MMFYKEKEEPELREELFENPGAAYRGAPFWAWNKKLNKKELVDQVEQFKKMGIYYLQVKSLNSNSFVCFQTSCCFIKFDFFSDDF